MGMGSWSRLATVESDFAGRKSLNSATIIAISQRRLLGEALPQEAGHTGVSDRQIEHLLLILDALATMPRAWAVKSA
jgi:hypothetical protein